MDKYIKEHRSLHVTSVSCFERSRARAMLREFHEFEH